MSSGYGFGPDIAITIGQWQHLEELMRDTGAELAAGSTSGFAPSVRGSAATFLAAWSGYAAVSATLAEGFVGALRSTDSLYRQTDTMSEAELKRLDGRLGPAR